MAWALSVFFVEYIEFVELDITCEELHSNECEDVHEQHQAY